MNATHENRPSWVPSELFPFESRFVELAGSRVHYVDEGAGPLLLLLHGNPTWSFLYRDIIRGSSSDFRCIALDYPGFGLSTAAAGYDFEPETHAKIVELFVERLDLTDITVFVQDWGGPIGLGAAGRHPDRFAKLIIGNTWAWPVNGDRHFERFSRLMGGAFGGFMIRNFNAFVNLLIPAGVKRHKVSRQVMTVYRMPFADRKAREATHIFPRAILRSRDYLERVEAGLPRLGNLPALILWGDRDIAFREKERLRFESAFPNHETVVLKGAGHFIQEDAADEIVSAIRAWWGIGATTAHDADQGALSD